MVVCIQLEFFSLSVVLDKKCDIEQGEACLSVWSQMDIDGKKEFQTHIEKKYSSSFSLFFYRARSASECVFILI